MFTSHHIAHVTSHASCVTCQKSIVPIFLFFFVTVIDGAYPDYLEGNMPFSMVKCESPDYSIIAQCFSIGVSWYVRNPSNPILHCESGEESWLQGEAAL